MKFGAVDGFLSHLGPVTIHDHVWIRHVGPVLAWSNRWILHTIFL